MRHALALLLLLRQATTQRCTSLAGPDCEIINGRAPARSPADEITKAKPSSWRERLLGVVRAHLEEGRDRADTVKGAFEVRGDLPDVEGAFELVAGAWLDQPEGWITVGLRGRFEDNCTLSGEITDGEGDIMAACSRFTLQRVDADEAADASIPLAGAWEGVYVCGGTPTRLVLRLSPDHAAYRACAEIKFHGDEIRRRGGEALDAAVRQPNSLVDFHTGSRARYAACSRSASWAR